MTHTFGIRREDKNVWERRVPLIPAHLRDILAHGDRRAVVQPSERRIFDDGAYREAGAAVEEDLSGCDVVFAVKEIPTSLFLPGRAYVFFSHTIKGQPYNMGMLRRLLELGATLIDYERIVDAQGRRLVLFSREAGQAGMIDALHILGRRLQWEGHETPLLDIGMSYTYADMARVRDRLVPVAERLRAEGLPPALSPLVVGFAGYGNVSQGAQEVLDLLPVGELSPAQLLRGELPTEHPLCKVVFREEDMVAPRAPDVHFELQDYYQRPEGYVGRFERFLPHLHLLLNGIYWEERYPRLVTNEALAELFAAGPTPRLRVIGDVSCDLQGSIQGTLKATMPDDPAYVLDPERGEITMGVEGAGPVIVAVDNLPAELPRDSSEQFSTSLRGFVPAMVEAARDVVFERYAVPPEIHGAVIVYNGELTPSYRYLNQYL